MVRNYALTKTDTHLHSLMVTMSQKSSVPQAVKSVSQALMSDKDWEAGSVIMIRDAPTPEALRTPQGYRIRNL